MEFKVVLKVKWWLTHSLKSLDLVARFIPHGWAMGVGRWLIHHGVTFNGKKLR